MDLHRLFWYNSAIDAIETNIYFTETEKYLKLIALREEYRKEKAESKKKPSFKILYGVN